MKSLTHHFLEGSPKLLAITSRFALIWYRKQNNHVNHKSVFPSSLLLEASHFSVINHTSKLRNASSILHLNPLMLKVLSKAQRTWFPPCHLFIRSKARVLHRISSLVFLTAFLLSILSSEPHGNEGSRRPQQAVREVLKMQPRLTLSNLICQHVLWAVA